MRSVVNGKPLISRFEDLVSTMNTFRNKNMAAYLGETKMKMLEEFGAIKEKYGTQPASCSNVFQSVCPWDSAGMSSIFMKLMVSFWNIIMGS